MAVERKTLVEFPDCACVSYPYVIEVVPIVLVYTKGTSCANWRIRAVLNYVPRGSYTVCRLKILTKVSGGATQQRKILGSIFMLHEIRKYTRSSTRIGISLSVRVARCENLREVIFRMKKKTQKIVNFLLRDAEALRFQRSSISLR